MGAKVHWDERRSKWFVRVYDVREEPMLELRDQIRESVASDEAR